MVRGDDKRERILAAALSLFAERGFYGTTVPEIASKADVGAGTIYRYFESKEVLVNELYQTWKGAAISNALDGFAFEANPREQFRMLWARWRDFIVDHPQEALFLELHHHGPYLDETSRAMEAQAMAAAVMLLETAKAKGSVRNVPVPVLIAFVQGVLMGIVKAHAEHQLLSQPGAADAAEICCWEAIRA